MELWDIYDENGQITGRTQPRGQSLHPGDYHLAVTVTIVNSCGEVFCTLRSKEKPLAPGMWESPGGGVQAGESSLVGAMRELEEETGIQARPDELVFLCRRKAVGYFMDCYGLRRDFPVESVRLQPGEVDGCAWAPLDIWERKARDGEILAGAYSDAFFQAVRDLSHTVRWPQEDASPALREKISALQALAWPDLAHLPWPEPEHVSSFCWMERDNLLAHAAVVGCGFSHKGQCYQARGIAEVVTHPDHRGKGLALSLLRQARAFIQASGADVCLFTCQPGLAKLYEKAGFTPCSGLELVGGTAERPFPSGPLGLAAMLDLLSPKAQAHAQDFQGGQIFLPLGEDKLW